ncbi:hypothetical protein [Sulfurovum mangrovi]|nr:hypothetical protein [Sulfurovum mangrovi]UFH59487.1 hypothetical protein LN246_01240 [Sulfurovum mangrovi]UFH60639.1 hypothetical protein LN246_13780 [Sulfurovum mangrovi]
MLYYYANSGHKIGLDRVKRAVALLKALNEKGVETRLLLWFHISQCGIHT